MLADPVLSEGRRHVDCLVLENEVFGFGHDVRVGLVGLVDGLVRPFVLAAVVRQGPAQPAREVDSPLGAALDRRGSLAPAVFGLFGVHGQDALLRAADVVPGEGWSAAVYRSFAGRP